jgi:glycosyltransferase involved in cell wall biosynthesis
LPGCDRAEFLGWQSRDNVAALLGRARAGIVTYHPVPGSLEAQPTKLFEYMSVGIPVIASDFLLWREIVGGTGCGLLVDPHDPKAIGDAITWVLGHPEEAEAMGRRGKEAIEKCYNWEKEAEKLVTFYKILFEGCKGGAKFSKAFYQEQNRVKR